MSGTGDRPAPSARRAPAGSKYDRSGPRRPRTAVKLARDPAALTSSVARRWLDVLGEFVGEVARDEGLAYARSGQVVSIEIVPGQIRAIVQGRHPKPYRVVLSVPLMTTEQWDRVVLEMAAQAFYVAKLLTNELPATLELEPFDADLLPSARLVTHRCTCEETAPCKHVAAVGYVVADRLETEPLQLLALRGLTAPQLLERLRQTRAMHSRGVAAAHADPLIPESQEEPPPLEECLEHYWRSGTQLASLCEEPPPVYAEHALLRRLGASPLNGRFPLAGLLASVYDTVARDAVRLRDRAEHIEEE